MIAIDVFVSDENEETRLSHLIYMGNFERAGIWIRRVNGLELPSRAEVAARHRGHRIGSELRNHVTEILSTPGLSEITNAPQTVVNRAEFQENGKKWRNRP